MSKDCTTHNVTLCSENKKFVKQVQATITRQSSISDAINLIINELRELKKLNNYGGNVNGGN